MDNHDANFNNNSNQNLIYAMNCKTTKIITIEDLQYIRIQIEIEIKMWNGNSFYLFIRNFTIV